MILFHDLKYMFVLFSTLAMQNGQKWAW